MNQRTRILLLLVILLLAAGTRFYGIDAQSYWNDEGTSVALAQRDITTITHNAANDIHPPLYYYVLHAWVSVFGSSEAGSRSLSAVLGIVLVASLYAITRKFGSEGVALSTAALATVNPLLVYYCQETRMYELASLFSLLSVGCLAWLLGSGASNDSAGPIRLKKALLWLIVTTLGVYTHYFVFAIVAAENVAVLAWLLLNRRTETKTLPQHTLVSWAVLQITLLALYAPWLAFSWSSLSAWPSVSAPMGLVELCRQVLNVYALGVTAPDSTIWTGLALLATLPAVLGLLIRQPGEDHLPSNRAGWLAGAYAFVPILVMFGLSLRQPMYKPKFFIVAVPAFCWLQATGIVRMASYLKEKTTHKSIPWLVSAVLVCAAIAGPLLSLRNLYWNPDYARDDYRGIVEYIESAATPNSAVLINAPAQVETFDLYYDSYQPVYPLPLQRPIDVQATEASLQQIASSHDRIYAILWATDESDPEGFIEGWLDQHLYKTMDSWFGNVRLAVYAVPNAPATAPETLVEATLGSTVSLRGYTITPERLTSGDILQLTLFWECTSEMDTRYKTFVHLLDQQGNIIGQRDSEPVGGSRPTDSWQFGELIADNYGLLIPPSSVPGEYSLRIGMYNPDTGERLPVLLSNGTTTDSILAPRISVALPDVPPPASALMMPQPHATDWPGISLVGHGLYKLGAEHIEQPGIYPTDPLKLELFWLRSQGSADMTWNVQVLQKGDVRWEKSITVLEGLLPLEAWQEGYILRDVHVLYPPSLEPGNYELVMTGSNGQRISLQSIRIQPTS